MREVWKALERYSAMGCGRHIRVWARLHFFGFAMLAFAGAADVHGQDVQADISASVGGGHARMIITFSQEAKAETRLANGILVITFRQPVAISVEKIERRLPGYVQAVRRDPDGSAIRFSLRQKVTVNVMEAGERLFIDLMPPEWVGLPPGLPQEVIDELSRRAREAERRARDKRPALANKPLPPVRLRVANAPTFSRFAFDMVEPVPIVLERDGQELRLLFDAPVKIDLGEAKMQLPAGVASLDVELESDRSTVKLVLAPAATVRELREQNSYLLDVMPSPIGTAQKSFEDLAAEINSNAAAQSAEMDGGRIHEKAAGGPDGSARIGSGDESKAGSMNFAGQEGGMEGIVAATVKRNSNGVGVAFTFSEPTAMAVFRRGEMIWVVIDSHQPIDINELSNDPTRIIRRAEYASSEFGGVLRLKLAQPRLPSVERQGSTWVLTFGDGVVVPGNPLPMRRTATLNKSAIAVIPLEMPGQLHRLVDPEIGDTLLVATAGPPSRGILRKQDFVEFEALASVHGVALVPLADDVSATLSSEGVTIERPQGLLISELAAPPPPPKAVTKQQLGPLDAEIWNAERDSAFYERESELLRTVAVTPAGQRSAARIMLARFYLANDYTAEAKGMLDMGMREDNHIQNYPEFYLLRGIAALKLNRPSEALRDLVNPLLAGMSEALLMRSIAYAALARWGDARDAFRIGNNIFGNLPMELQQLALLASLQAGIEVRDFIDASRLVHEIESTGTAKEREAVFAVLAGRVAEGVGRFERAKAWYEAAAESETGAAAAEARLRSIEMRHGRGDLDKPKAIERLETLMFSWRGDRIELETMRLLGRLYVGESRYRDAFRLLDSALLVNSESDVTRAFHAEMATVFEDLFLTGKSESLPPVKALALYYDFSKLTPIGRRGDELIRRLADRLVSVDLLDQASELLDHQVEYRLSGAARAQVATRLAVIHLMNRKPAEAVRVLTATRIPEMAQELRDQRLLIEARALSEIGRHRTGLELIQNLEGHEVERLRADIAWAAKNWREAGERLEKLLGERWKNENELIETERYDVLRAALAYAVGNEAIGIYRLREKYLPRMKEDAAERTVLDLLAGPEGTSAKTLAMAAKTLANFDNLGSFIKLYRARYPERPLPPDPSPISASAKRKVSAR